MENNHSFNRVLFFSALFGLAQLSIEAQTVVKGKVLDKDNLPVIGATVRLNEENVKTITDLDGAFVLNSARTLTKADRITVSHLGYEAKSFQFDAKRQDDWILTLNEQDVELNDVVVTALGIKRSERGLGYATRKLDGDDITQAMGTNWSQGLAGKVAGLSISNSAGPLGSTRISLRGDVSLNQ